MLRERARRQAEERANASTEVGADAEPSVGGTDASAGTESAGAASAGAGQGGFAHAAPPAGTAHASEGRAGARVDSSGEARAAHGHDTSALHAEPTARDDGSVLAPLRRPVVLAALLFAFALGVYLRPVMVTEARAPEPSGAPGATVAELERLAGRRPTGAVLAPTAAELEGATSDLAAALLDPANRVTVQVITYRDRASMVPYAEDTVAHLVASGFRALGPLRVGDDLVVLAEAAPTKAELDPLRAAIAELADANGKEGQFADALVRNIDDLIERGAR